MRTGRIVLLVLAVFAVAAAGARVEAALGDDGDRDCRRVQARGVGQDLGNGQTTARITRGGVLNGTTNASFAITGGAPPVLTFAGTVTFDARRGTLPLPVTGTFDVSTGRFQASGDVAGGTGVFRGATGFLRLEGVQDLATGRFTETVTGRLCLADDDEDDDDGDDDD